jgi:hypothetical protein
MKIRKKKQMVINKSSIKKRINKSKKKNISKNYRFTTAIVKKLEKFSIMSFIK